MAKYVNFNVFSSKKCITDIFREKNIYHIGKLFCLHVSCCYTLYTYRPRPTTYIVHTVNIFIFGCPIVNDAFKMLSLKSVYIQGCVKLFGAQGHSFLNAPVPLCSLNHPLIDYLARYLVFQVCEEV